MTGTPAVMALVRESVRVELVQYPYGSLGIIRAGHIQAVWEADEEEDCIGAFSRMAEFSSGLPKIILLRTDAARTRAQRMSAQKNAPA